MMATKQTITGDMRAAGILRQACSPQQAMQHLRALTEVHDDVLAALACKQAATCAPVPDPIAVCRARWELSRVNRRHQTLVDTILTSLLPGAGSDVAQVIGRLRDNAVRQTQKSTRHIQSWAPDRIMTQWPLFCAESARVQADIRQRIETEKQLIGGMLRSQCLVSPQRESGR